MSMSTRQKFEKTQREKIANLKEQVDNRDTTIREYKKVNTKQAARISKLEGKVLDLGGRVS